MVEGVDVLDRDTNQLRWEVGLDPHRQRVAGLQQRIRLRTVIFILVLVHHLYDVIRGGLVYQFTSRFHHLVLVNQLCDVSSVRLVNSVQIYRNSTSTVEIIVRY